MEEKCTKWCLRSFMWWLNEDEFVTEGMRQEAIFITGEIEHLNLGGHGGWEIRDTEKKDCPGVFRFWQSGKQREESSVIRSRRVLRKFGSTG